MDDKQFLNHFSSFTPASNNGTALSQLPTTSSSYELGPQPGYQPQHPQPQSNGGGDSIHQLFSAQQAKIDSLANSIAQISQLIQHKFSEQAEGTNVGQRQVYSDSQSPADFPISDEHDLRNAWNLACKGNSGSTKKKILSHAKKMGLAAALPESAREWAQENNISLFDEPAGFATSVPLSDEDSKLVKSAYLFMSNLKDSDLMLSVYGIVKSSLSHLNKADLTQVLSDLTETKQSFTEPDQSSPADVVTETATPADEGKESLAEADTTSPAEEPCCPTDTVEQIADAVEEAINSDEFAALISDAESDQDESVDPDIWQTATSVAKARHKEPSREDIMAVYNVLISAKGQPTVKDTASPLGVFSDLELLKQVYCDSKKSSNQPDYLAARTIRDYSSRFPEASGNPFSFNSDIPDKLTLADRLTSLIKRNK